MRAVCQEPRRGCPFRFISPPIVGDEPPVETEHSTRLPVLLHTPGDVYTPAQVGCIISPIPALSPLNRKSDANVSPFASPTSAAAAVVFYFGSLVSRPRIELGKDLSRLWTGRQGFEP